MAQKRKPHNRANVLELVPQVREYLVGGHCNQQSGTHMDDVFLKCWFQKGNLLFAKHTAAHALCRPCVEWCEKLLRMPPAQRRSLAKKKSQYERNS